jgi:GT2 family glycosyltransferase
MVSVVIVSHNGRIWLEGCLSSLSEQTFTDYEVIVVDNASADGSAQWIEREYPLVKLIPSTRNLGFAEGSNRGIEASLGDYILLLNNDTYADPRFLERLLSAFETIPNLGAVSGKIVLMDDPARLDNCGSFWTNTTFLYHYGYQQDESLPKFNRALPVFSCNGAAMLIKKEALDAVGMLDGDFWCYNEEVDLCHRLWIAGYECWYFPEARVFHAKGATSSRMEGSTVQYHSFKNRLSSYLKNYQPATLAWVLPVYLSVSILISVFWLVRRKRGLFFSIYRAMWWNVANARGTLSKRRRVQASRRRDDDSLFPVVRKNPPRRYYYYLLVGLERYDEGNDFQP